MKTMYRILLSVLLFICVSNISYSQNLMKVDTAITILLENNVTNEESRCFSFDIYLLRSSGMWHLWENATFQMIFKDFYGSEIDYSKFDVEVDASTSEVVTIRNGSPAYDFYAKVLHNPMMPDMSRVKLMVLGPEEAIYSRLFEDNLKLKLCTIILKAKDMTSLLPVTMEWKEFKGDNIYFQATAYTYIDSVNTAPEYTIVKQNEDHIEIGWITKHLTTPNPDPIMDLAFFEVEYTGNLNSVCRYSTLQEIDNAGFTIKRGIWHELYTDSNIAERNKKYNELPDSIFNVVVGDYRLPQFNSRMKGQIFSHTGKQYVPIPDTLSYRIVNYVYRLYNEKASEPGLIKLATRNLLTPHGVISDVKASPNPTSGRSIIEYTIDDDVYLTCEVFDQNGLSVKKLSDDVNGLLDMKYVPRGVYYAEFNAPELAAQGLYEIIFIAYPVNDKAVEISRASVKIQLVRGYSNN